MKWVTSGSERELDPGFTVSVNSTDKDRWHSDLVKFDDSNFYQTWSYSDRRWGEDNTTCIVLSRDGTVAAMALGRVVRFGLLPGGVVHMRWGPVWMKEGDVEDLQVLRNILRALRNEYACRRGFIVNLLPKEVEERHAHLRDIYEEEGFVFRESTERTFAIDLGPGIDELMANLRQSWRKSLRNAKKEDLELFTSQLPEHKDWVIRIVREMESRKKYATFVDVEEMMEISDDLPEAMRLDIWYCRHNEELIACLGWWKAGRIGIPLVGGTGDKALEFNASNLLWWKMVEDYRERGFQYCDLAGTNPDTNPGVHLFKKGLAGKNAEPTRYLGQFTVCESRLSAVLYSVASKSRDIYKRLKAAVGRVRQAT